MAYKLTYFNFRGLAETIRFLLAYSEIDYEDNRIDVEQWPELKPTTPFGKLPILEIDGKVINQTTSICRYLAKNADLMGDDDWETLLIDVAVDNIRDVQQAIMPYYYAKEDAKTEILESLTKETLPFYMSKLENIVNENKRHFVNGKLTWADIFFASMIETLSGILKINIIEEYPNLQELKDTVFAIPQIKSWVEKRPDTEL